MRTDVTIAVATFGDMAWFDLAQRAIASARDQALVVHVHGDTLHDARNDALDMVDTPWVVHLDGDDELEPGYVDTLAQGFADVRAPSVRYVRHGRVRQAWVPTVAGHGHQCTGSCLRDGNWLVVGAMARTQLLRDVGGWEPWPVFEDWALWARCWQAGATVEAIPAAVYRAHVNLDSRNRAPTRDVKLRTHREIAQAVFGPQAAAA